jgi:chromosome segregation ATPase
MSKKTLVVLSLALTAVFLLSSTACVSKKRLRTVEQESAERLAEANARIDELSQRNGELDKSLADARGLLDKAKAENQELAAAAASLKTQLAALENQKAELDKALAEGRETEASYQKKVRGLNGLIAGLRKDVAEKESSIAAKDTEIASLRQSEAQIKAAADEQARKLAALSSEKDGLTAQLDKTISGKKSITLVLGVLLALAVILAVIGFARRRKGPATA